MKYRHDRKWRCLLLGCWLVCGAAVAVEDVAAPDEIRRVVVIHFDATRVDDWRCYGGIPDTSNVDAVAATGLRYTNAVTSTPYTSASIATFMTGQYPDSHRVHAPGAPLSEELTTLAEILRQNGFRAGGFCSNPILFVYGIPRRGRPGGPTSLFSGLDQGFDMMTPSGKGPPSATGISSAACTNLTNKALRFVRDHRDDKFFLWMLHMDPHHPYNVPEPYDTIYLDHPDIVAQNRRLEDRRRKGKSIETGDLIARHKGAVAAVDESIGVLLDELEPLEGKTLLIITSDHGESLGDDDYWFGHGKNLRHPCINVPLVMRCEGVVPVGIRDTLVGNADLAPTILDLLQIDASALSADGRSLAPTFAEEDPWPERLVPIQSDWLQGDSYRRGIRSKHFSYQAEFDRETNALISASLFDHREDPREAHNLNDAKADLAAQFRGFVQTIFFSSDSVTPDLSVVDDPEIREQLRALGYLK